MKEIRISGITGDSTICIGETLAHLHRYLPSNQGVIVADAAVQRLHGRQFPDMPVLPLESGEATKSLATVERLYRQFLDAGVDRSTPVIGIGGGVVCDIAGFAAATYLRGLPFGSVPTTLLAQVDASVGGKNGVNFMGYKNLVGTFRQPDFVLCDVALLDTLDVGELVSGMAEVVKHAVIADATLFSFLETHAAAALNRDRDVMQRLVSDSVAIKAAVVTRDETETGERRKLNFGHTVGHAVEHLTGMRHGAAVSLGMVIACRLSVRWGRLAARRADRVERLLEQLGLPTRERFDAGALMAAIRRDKKRESDQIHFVRVDEIGEAVVETIALDFLESELAAVLADMR